MSTTSRGTAYVNTIPTAGGKPAQMALSPAGDLWIVMFGTGGNPSKPFGIECYSITNPASPQRVSFTPTFGWFNVEAIQFRGSTLFALAGSDNAIHSVDTSNPAAPTNISSLVLAATPFDLQLSSDQFTALVACTAAGLRAVNVINPAAMVALSTVAGTFFGVDTSLWPLVVTTEAVTNQLRIYDYTNPALPTLVGSLALPVSAPTALRRLVVDPTTNMAFVAVTGGGPLTGGQEVLQVNVSIPAAPSLVTVIPCAVAGDDTPLRLATVAGKRVLTVPLNSQSFSPARIELFDVTSGPAKFLKGIDLGQVVYDTMIVGEVTYVGNRGGAQELLVLSTSFITGLQPMTTYAGPQPGSLIWVAPNGDDTTGQRARVDRPFKTIQAALSVVQVKDAVLVAPGTYNENIVIPDIDGLAIIGENTNTTIITAAVGNTISWTPAAGPGALVQSFKLANLSILNSDPAGYCIRFNGTAVVSPNTFLVNCFAESLFIVKTGGGQAVNFTCMGRLIASLCYVQGATFQAANVSRIGFNACSLNSFDLGWNTNGGAAFPGLGREGYYLANSSFVEFNGTLTGAPIFVLDRTSTISGNLTATALVSNVIGTNLPAISLNGTMGALTGGGVMTITLPGEIGPVPPFVSFAKGMFYGGLTISKSAGAARLRVAGPESSWMLGAPVGLPGTISAGALIDLDLRDAFFQQSVLAVAGGGTIDRSTHSITGVVSAAGTFAQAITPPFPTGSTYTVSIELRAAATGILANIASAPAPSTSSFSWVGSGAGATLGFTLTRS